ncbi:MAG: gas vesicle protein GvpG [Candidatus Bipolaricaulia bacterium]
MAFLVDDILLAPVKFPAWMAKKLMDQAEEEMTDESKVRELLLELQMKLELGDIGEEEYEKQETEIMEWLNFIRARKKENG